jgi:DnaK suppressor protein
MKMSTAEVATIRQRLLAQRAEFAGRIATIHAHARDPLDRDSEEQAAQLGNVAVVSALEAEATAELAAIDAALQRLEAGSYGSCLSCGEPIDAKRLEARPASTRCLDCADLAAR